MLFHRSRQDPGRIVYRDEYYPDRVFALRRVPGARFTGWCWTFPATSWQAAVEAFALLPAHHYPYLVDLLTGREFQGLAVHVGFGRVALRGPADVLEDARANLSVLCGYEEAVQTRAAPRRTFASLAQQVEAGPGYVVYRYPAGLTWRVARFFRAAGAAVTTERLPPPPPSTLRFPRAPELRDYQQRVAAEAPRRRRATLVMPTGAGKTRTAAGIIAALGQRTLFLTSAIELARQAAATFEEHLGVRVGRIVQGRVDLADVTVATVQSLLARVDSADAPELDAWLRGVGLLFVDEGHGLGAQTIYRAATLVPPEAYAFALTATPWREDHREVMIEAATGPVWRPRGTLDADLVKAGYLLPVQVTCVPFRHPGPVKGSPVRRFQVAIEENLQRNALVIELARMAMRRYQTLVLVKTIEHGAFLARVLHVPFLHGQLPARERQAILEVFAARRIRCVVATPLLDQGVDVPAAECLIDAVPRRSPVKILQTIGRVRRPAPGKQVARVVTVLDLDGGTFQRASLRKLDVIEQAGFEVRWLDAATLQPSDPPAALVGA